MRGIGNNRSKVKKTDQAEAPLTERQKEVLGAVADFLATNGIYPSLAQISTLMGWKSNSSACSHLEAAEKKGYITGVKFKVAGRTARGLCFTEKGARFFHRVEAKDFHVRLRILTPELVVEPAEAVALAQAIVTAATIAQHQRDDPDGQRERQRLAERTHRATESGGDEGTIETGTGPDVQPVAGVCPDPGRGDEPAGPAGGDDQGVRSDGDGGADQAHPAGYGLDPVDGVRGPGVAAGDP